PVSKLSRFSAAWIEAISPTLAAPPARPAATARRTVLLEACSSSRTRLIVLPLDSTHRDRGLGRLNSAAKLTAEVADCALLEGVVLTVQGGRPEPERRHCLIVRQAGLQVRESDRG